MDGTRDTLGPLNGAPGRSGDDSDNAARSPGLRWRPSMKHRGRLFLALALLSCGCGGSDFSSLSSDDGGPDADASSSSDADAGDAQGGDELADGAPHDDGAPSDAPLVDADDGGPGDGSHGLCCWTNGNAPIACASGGFQNVYECIDGWFNDADPDKELCSPACLTGQWCQVDYVLSGHPTGTVKPCP